MPRRGEGSVIRVLVGNDQDGKGCAVHQFVGDRTEQGTAQWTAAAMADGDHLGAAIRGHLQQRVDGAVLDELRLDVEGRVRCRLLGSESIKPINRRYHS